MKNILIEKNKDNFYINCNKDINQIMIEGSSYPENAVEFFEPVFEWIDTYFDMSEYLKISLKVIYMNTSTTKCMLDLVEVLEDYYQDGKEIEIDWFYKSGDVDIFDTGEDFKEDASFKFNIIEY